MNNPDIKIIVWNTNVSSARSEVDPIQWRTVKRAILSLIFQGYDFIGLIEINDESIRQLNSIISKLKIPYKIAIGTQERNNTRFDTCIIYKANLFMLIPAQHNQDCENTDFRWKGKLAKSGQKYDFFDLAHNAQLSIVLAHWPSLLTPEIDKKRLSVAENLRFHVNEWLLKNSNIIIAGDFNTEPYCDSLLNNLCSFREPLAPSRSPEGFELFYNPSWNLLNIPPPVAYETNSPPLGTYFYKSHHNQHWFNFDQVMFSKSLVDGVSGWTYLENSLKILNIFDLTNKKKRWSDHLPIQFKLEWK